MRSRDLRNPFNGNFIVPQGIDKIVVIIFLYMDGHHVLLGAEAIMLRYGENLLMLFLKHLDHFIKSLGRVIDL